MKCVLLLIVIMLLPAGVAHAAKPPVIVELFTSEGCSDCPPADKMLDDLQKNQPVETARIIAISEHVDYFDSTAWRDAFAAPAFTQRQQQYARWLAADVYTPQMIVDGSTYFVGSDREKAVASIRLTATAAKTFMSIDAKAIVNSAGASVVIKIDAPSSTSDSTASIRIAIVQDGLHSAVTGGENGGQRLDHPRVVRSLVDAGKIDLKHPKQCEVQTELELPAKGSAAEAHLVAFVQNDRTGQIIAAAEVPWPGLRESETKQTH